MKTNKIISNSIINLSMQIIPIFIAIIFIPISIEALGNELFGIYSLIVTFIVLFNYLNFGIAPATTKEISKNLAKNNHKMVLSLLVNSFLMMLLIGIMISIIFITYNNDIAIVMLKEEKLVTILSELIFLLGVMSPFLMIVIFLRSALEAKQIFLVTSLNRAFLNSLIFISPTIVYIDGFNIVSVFKLLIFVYMFSVMILTIIVYKEFLKDKEFTFRIKDSKNLLNIGFWMMLSSLAGIGLYYADRFMIGSIISATAIAYYVAAYDLVTRLNIVSGSLTSALFPAFAHWFELEEKEKIRNAVIFVSKIILFLVAIVGFLLIVYAKSFLYLWINEEYSNNSYLILQLLTIGVLFNTLSVVPFRTLSAIGFPNIVAIVYIIEMPIFVITTYFLIIKYGLIGAVIGYNLRALSEMIILYFIMINKRTGLNFEFNIIQLSKNSILYFFIYIAGFLISNMENLYIKVLLTILIVIIASIMKYMFLLNSKEKSKINEYTSKIKAKL